MVNVTNCTNIYVRFRPVKFFFCHNSKRIKLSLSIINYKSSILLSRRGELNPRPLPYQGSALPLSYSGLKKGAGDGTRIRDPQLGRLMLYQLSYSRLISSKEIRELLLHIFAFTLSIRLKWGEQDSNLRRHSPADLQSAPVGHFGISPLKQSLALKTHSYKSFKSR